MYVFLWFVACKILGWVENDTFITTYFEYFLQPIRNVGRTSRNGLPLSVKSELYMHWPLKRVDL